MSARRTAVRTMKKIALLTGTSSPEKALREAVAWHGFENPGHLLRSTSPRKLELEMTAIQRKFPETGRRIAAKPAAERIASLKRVDALGIKMVESALKNGLAFQELLSYSNGKRLAEFIARTTPERVRKLRSLGFNEKNARNLCILIEKQGWEKTRRYIEQVKSTGVNLNNLGTSFFREFLLTGHSNLEPVAAERVEERNRQLGITRGLERLVKRKRFVDFRRHGRPLFSKNYVFGQGAREKLAAKSIRLFDFSGKVSRVASSNKLVGKESNRHVFTLEVPEIDKLIREAKPKRQHIRQALCFADLMLLEQRIHIFELQSDIVGKLGPSREKYANWPGVTILGIADFAAKHGIKYISMSSPHIIKQVWPHLGRELTQKLYYELPTNMGFDLMQLKKKIVHYDSAFGEEAFGKSDILWDIETETLKKRFPEFFG